MGTVWPGSEEHQGLVNGGQDISIPWLPGSYKATEATHHLIGKQCGQPGLAKKGSLLDSFIFLAEQCTIEALGNRQRSLAIVISSHATEIRNHPRTIYAHLDPALLTQQQGTITNDVDVLQSHCGKQQSSTHNTPTMHDPKTKQQQRQYQQSNKVSCNRMSQYGDPSQCNNWSFTLHWRYWSCYRQHCHGSCPWSPLKYSNLLQTLLWKVPWTGGKVSHRRGVWHGIWY